MTSPEGQDGAGERGDGAQARAVHRECSPFGDCGRTGWSSKTLDGEVSRPTFVSLVLIIIHVLI